MAQSRFPSRTRDGDNIDYDWLRHHRESKHIEVGGADCEVEDRAGCLLLRNCSTAIVTRRDCCHRQREGANCCLHSICGTYDCYGVQLVIDRGEPANV